MAAFTPISRDRRCVPPAPGIRPILASGSARRSLGSSTATEMAPQRQFQASAERQPCNDRCDGLAAGLNRPDALTEPTGVQSACALFLLGLGGAPPGHVCRHFGQVRARTKTALLS